MSTSSLVARPCLAIVNTEFLSYLGNISLGDVSVWGNYLELVVSARLCRLRHVFHKTWSAVGVNGMVARMICNIH